MHRFPRSRFLLAAAALSLSLALGGVVEDSQKLVKDGKYDQAIAMLEKADAKQPAVTKAIVSAHMAKADYFMNNPEVPPRQKYPTALGEYRKVLVYDKTNKKAQDNVQLIEGIYKQMGREIPK